MYLNKILPLFFSPIVLVLALVLASVIFRRRLLALCAATLLLVASLPVVADRALWLVQGDLVRLHPEEVPRREAVVVLAGGLGYTQGSRGPMPEWGTAVDRVFAGIELMRAGRAERVIFSSGRGVGTTPGCPTRAPCSRPIPPCANFWVRGIID